MKSMLLTVGLATTFAAGMLASSDADADRIKNMPGYGEPKQPQYSGYLSVDDPQGTMQYHYWFAQSANKPTTDPVVLWLNGGPGASSIGYGLFTELGPYFLDDASFDSKTGVPTVFDNPYSWSTMANMLFLEAPPSVGYSYCADSHGDYSDECGWNDTTQARANYGALQAFFNKFPEFKSNDFYITGESYGGMYVPTLVEQVYLHRADADAPRLQGFAVGNGIIGHSDNFSSVYGREWIHAQFLYNSRFVSDSLHEEVDDACGTFTEPLSDKCNTLLQTMSDSAGSYYVYNVYDTCGTDQYVDATGSRLSHAQQRVLRNGSLRMDPPVPCGMQNATATYLNLPVVREAIHIKDEAFYGHPFTMEAGKYLHYNESRKHLLIPDQPGGPSYHDFIKTYRTLIYNGDFDGCVPYLHSQEWTMSMGYRSVSPWQPWTVAQQVAGYSTVYDANNFTFATVKGSGHMVPQYKPKEALVMFAAFLEGCTGLRCDGDTHAAHRQHMDVVLNKAQTVKTANTLRRMRILYGDAL